MNDRRGRAAGGAAQAGEGFFSLSLAVISLFWFTAIEWHSVFVQSQFTANGNAKAPTIDNSSRLFSKDIPLLLLRIPGNTFQHLV